MEYIKFIENLTKEEKRIKDVIDKNKHYCYVLKCSDNTLYTGYSTDPIRRLYEHNYLEKGAKYTKKRRPVKLLQIFEFDSRSSATSFEYWFKQLSKEKKLDLLNLHKSID